MKEDFLVINHNILLRKLYLKCNTLFLIYEYYNNKQKKNILNNLLEENVSLNKYLDNKTNKLKENDDTNRENDDIKINTNIEKKMK